MKKLLYVICAVVFLQITTVQVKADDKAMFYVQTATELSDDMIRVSVYLDGAEDVAAIDAQIEYDPQKVSFESSSLGESFNSSFSDINYDEKSSSIHYVLLYTEPVKAHGIVMNIDFRLNGSDKSYQPKLQVNDLIDGSDEMKNISYEINYQQSDGKWQNQPDESAQIADKSIVDSTLQKYGSDTDIKNEGKTSENAVSVDKNNTLTSESNGTSAEQTSENEQQDDESNYSSAESDKDSSDINNNKEQDGNSDHPKENDTESISDATSQNSTESISSNKSLDGNSDENETEAEKNAIKSDENGTKRDSTDKTVYLILIVMIILLIAAGTIAKKKGGRHL